MQVPVGPLNPLELSNHLHEIVRSAVVRAASAAPLAHAHTPLAPANRLQLPLAANALSAGPAAAAAASQAASKMPQKRKK